MHLNKTQNKITANYEIKARKEKELPQKDRNGRKISKYGVIVEERSYAIANLYFQTIICNEISGYIIYVIIIYSILSSLICCANVFRLHTITLPSLAPVESWVTLSPSLP